MIISHVSSYSSSIIALHGSMSHLNAAQRCRAPAPAASRATTSPPSHLLAEFGLPTSATTATLPAAWLPSIFSRAKTRYEGILKRHCVSFSKTTDPGWLSLQQRKHPNFGFKLKLSLLRRWKGLKPLCPILLINQLTVSIKCWWSPRMKPFDYFVPIFSFLSLILKTTSFGFR